MSLFRVYVDGELFYHPNLSRLAITQAQVKEDAEHIDSLTLSAPFQSSLSFQYSAHGLRDRMQERGCHSV